MQKFFEYVIFIVIQVLFLTIGSNRLTSLLIRNHTPPNLLSTKYSTGHYAYLLFSLTFSCSTLVTLFVPWCQVYTFLKVNKGWKHRPAAYIASVTTCGYLYMLIGIPTTINTSSMIELSIIRTSMIGVTVISILSGFGMANAPLTVWYQRHVSEHDYRIAERAYAQTNKMIAEKKMALGRMKQQQERQSSTEQASTSGYIGRFVSSLFGKGKDQEMELLQTEIEQLEGLAVSMNNDLEELERSRARTKFIVTAVSVVLQRQSSMDPITRTLSMIISHFDGYNIDPTFWSQQLSFWFAGIIVFSSVRSFLKLLSKLLEIFLLKITFSTNNILLLIAQVMGMYFLSSVLMIQLNLPLEYKYLLSSSLQSIELDIYKYWSDTISCIACILSILIICVLRQTQDATSMTRDFADMELLVAENGLRT
ncbi:hypothetical protein G6F70_008672 [Rhizopus microsporus]|nr:hypothetical protein G6F71_008598 [Rhizopus microsporus]KAG1194867.1 hypothetical protein G6F70_008672 [Rhizopus microsporus]KAG1211400.1 hypothetical protein G6F69_004634 [Rhizopus microsporus]KAG1227278.1 hypothetical protein G6F67_008545 [Rhizopus microsporus]KAG1258951.1 hypothetical protein G6F68_008452 [Rhizopus microsporus]